MSTSSIYAEIEKDPVAAFIQHTGTSIDTALQLLPDYMQPGIARYVICGIKPGSFLLSLFSGERELAERRADDTNKPLVMNYFAFIETECPRDCHGSPEKIQSWIKQGGIIGKDSV